MSYLRPSLQASNPQLAQQPLPPPPPQEPRLPVEPLLDTRMAPGREIHLLELPCVEDKIKEQDQCCRIYNRSFKPPDHSPYLRNLGCSGTATGSGWLQLQRLIHRLSVTFSPTSHPFPLKLYGRAPRFSHLTPSTFVRPWNGPPSPKSGLPSNPTPINAYLARKYKLQQNKNQ